MPVAKPGKKPGRRRRPSWHKPLGLAIVGVAMLLVVVNDLVLAGLSTPLPGGHSELYFMSGLAVAAFGAWLTGLFDPVQ